jgi:hypothetical protein
MASSTPAYIRAGSAGWCDDATPAYIRAGSAGWCDDAIHNKRRPALDETLYPYRRGAQLHAWGLLPLDRSKVFTAV